MSARELKEQILRCRDLTDRPFGVDILFAEIKADKADSTVLSYSSNVQHIWMGSRFVASVESYAHSNYKNKIVEIDEEGHHHAVPLRQALPAGA